MNRNEPVASQHASNDRIDESCDAFEQALRNGERPRIADFVDLAGATDRDALFCELVLVEVEFRRKAGEKPSRQDYLDAFPEFSEQVAAIDFKGGWTASPATVGMGETESPEALAPGTVIAHFLLSERLGAGGMGEVWKAWDSRLKRPVAIKLPRAGELSEADLHRFLREGRAAAQLRHPQLAAVHDTGRHGELVYIVADYVEGDDLRKHLAKQRLSFPTGAALCADVAEALHHAHERGVVHRDLKPANIIVDKAGRPHVIDFGLAKWSSDERDLTQKGELLGTPAYMAPEQACGDTESIGPHTDVYALGAILYELITGRCPFSGGTAAVVQAIVDKDPPLPHGIDRTIPRDLETICLKALEKDPKKRYRTAQEMAVDLRRFAGGEPILARRVSHLEKGWRWLRRRPAVAASILLFVVAAGAIIAAGSFAKKNRELLGYHTVSLTTEPEGARVAFARLTEFGELIPDQVILTDGVTPLRVELLPGDYFVEAVLPDGRFHQVVRRVSRDPLSVSYKNSRSILANDGSIILPDIRIPSADVTQGMAYVPMTTKSNALSSGGQPADLSFYVDPDDKNADIESGLASFEKALHHAETFGKRLPTKLEFEYLLKMDESTNALSREPSGSRTDASSSVIPTTESAPIDGEQPIFLRYIPSFTSGSGFRCVRSSRPFFIVTQ